MSDHCGSRGRGCSNRGAAIYAACSCECDPCLEVAKQDCLRSLQIQLSDSKRLFREHESACGICNNVGLTSGSTLCQDGQDLRDMITYYRREQDQQEVKQES